MNSLKLTETERTDVNVLVANLIFAYSSLFSFNYYLNIGRVSPHSIQIPLTFQISTNIRLTDQAN